MKLNIRARTVDLWVFEDLREEQIRASVFMRIKAAQSMPNVQFSNTLQVCVRGWNTGVDPSSSRKKPRKVVLRSSAIFWSECIREPLGWCYCRMRAVNRLFIFTWAKELFGAVFAEFARFYSNGRHEARRMLLDMCRSCGRQR